VEIKIPLKDLWEFLFEAIDYHFVPTICCPSDLLALLMYRACHISRPAMVVFFSGWTEQHQDRYILQSHRGLIGQVENTLLFNHRNYNCLMFGQFKMCTLFDPPLSFIFPETRTKRINSEFPPVSYILLSSKY